MFKRILTATVILMLLAGVSGCGDPGEPVNHMGPDEEEETIMPDELPAEIQAWIEEAKTDFAAQTREYEGLLYLLVTYGEKPTGGYTVEITEIVEAEDQLTVKVAFTEPGADEMVTQAFTYPYDLAMLEDPQLPVEFVATGAETDIPVK